MSGEVASLTNNQLLFQGTIVTPSGLLPSDPFWSYGVARDGTFAVVMICRRCHLLLKGDGDNQWSNSSNPEYTHIYF